MAGVPSKTQLDKLGDRLRAGSRDEVDLRALDHYRRSFRPAYDSVVQSLKELLKLEGTGRPAKTTGAIVDKLNRQPIRLTQIQDIAGLRLVVDSVLEQDRIVAAVHGAFESTVDDRRIVTSHGYRAVHVVVRVLDRLVEVQIRTEGQHSWAELSEKLSDVIDPSIKYGGGPKHTLDALSRYSQLLAEIEQLERSINETRQLLLEVEGTAAKIAPDHPESPRLMRALQDLVKTQDSNEKGVQQVNKQLAEKLVNYYNELVERLR